MTAAPSVYRTVILLALAQAMAMTGSTIVVTTVGVVGKSIAASPGLATLPLALQFIAIMLMTVPASLFMRRVGRRAGFSLGAAVGILSGLGAAWSIMAGSFALFAAAVALFGVSQSFALYYRFAATDAAPPALRGRAVSLVLAGGVAAGFLGPSLAVWSLDAVEGAPFAGSFLVVAGLAAVALLLLQFIRIPGLSVEERATEQRPLWVIARQPVYVVAALSAMVGFASMMLVMTATPIAMGQHNHDFPSAAMVIQWHVVAMYAPSFVTGHLIQRFGVLNVILAGAGLLLGSVAVGWMGTDLPHFWGALVLLGAGWNLMFVGGTTLLTEAYRPGERAKAQALNELLVFGLVSTASVGAGALQHFLGWEWVNLAVLPGVAVLIVAVFWLRARRVAVAA